MNIKHITLLLAAVLISTSSFADANTDLAAACKAGDLEAAKKAISEGAKVNALDEAGNPAISSAFFWPEIVKLLLDNGADPNLGNTTALFQTACSYSSETMKLQLDAGADPNAPTISDPALTFKILIAKEKSKVKIDRKRMTNCVGGATYSPSAYAKALEAGDIADYLKQKGM